MNQQDLLQPAAGWAAPQDTRLPPPPPRERGLLFRTLALASRWFGRPELPHIFPVLNINRRIFPAWLFFASRMMPFGKLPATVREKLILRVAWNCRSRYEWGQHAEIALRVGVTDKEIAAIARDQDAGDTEGDKVLARACEVAGIPFDQREAHSALYDAQRTAELFCTIINRFRQVGGWPPPSLIEFPPTLIANNRPKR